MKKSIRLTVLILFAAGLFAPAHALMLAGSGTDRNTSAPTNDPNWCHIGWTNVGSVRSPFNTSRAGVVYLCDNWFITTYHAWYLDSPTGVVVGVTGYTVDTNSMIRLTNSIAGVSTNADVALFRVTQKPNLPPLNLTTMSPGGLWFPVNFGGNKTIFMIGSGHPRTNLPTYWDAGWTNTTPSNAVYSGYKFWPDRSQCVLRWGSNQIDEVNSTATLGSPFDDILALKTTFNTNAGPDECQIAPLDSGGGVFYKNNGYWELAGLMVTMSQPAGTTTPQAVWGIADGGFSYIADLSYYRDQIMDIIKPSGGWPDLMPNLSETGRQLQTNEPVNITITTTNKGTGTASNHVTTLRIIVNGRTSEVVRTEIPLLNGGASVTSSYTFVTNTPGTYTLMAAADSSNVVHESYEQNNTKTIVFQVGPDLSISGAGPFITKAGGGESASVIIVTKNNGADIAAGPFETTLYISTNKNFTTLSEEELLNLQLVISNQVPFSNMPPWFFSTNTLSFTAPTNAGTYYIRARTDPSNTVAEASEANNWGPPLMLFVGPDLIISGAWPAATNAAGGAPVSIQVVTKNDGTDVADPFQTRLYLSTNNNLTTLSEAELRNLTVSTPVSFQNLSANASSTNSFTVTAPTSAGTYYLRARTDPSNTVSEANEANNWGTLLTIGVGPDLVIAGSTPGTTNAAGGAPVSVEVVTRNDGAGAAGPFQTRLYLSTNDNFTTLNEAELRNLTVSTPVSFQNLSANASSTNSFTVTAPASAGTYYLRARTDPSNTVSEANEANNWGTLLTIGVGPDLVIAGSTPGTTNAAAGSSVSIQVVTKNQGASDVTNDFVLGFYLLNSSNAGGDTPIKEQTIQGLPTGKSVTNTFTFIAPANNGRYRLIAKADDYDSSPGSTNKDAVAEAYEANNEGYPGHYTILYIEPDLSVSFAKTNAVRAMANSSVTLDLTTRNSGGESTTGVDTTLYLSSTKTFDSGTYTNLQTKVSNIAGYGSWTEPFEFRAPRQPGTYYLIAQVDGSRLIAEIDENNNLSEILTLEVFPMAMPWLNLLLE